jgi:hypothetical protein
MPTKTERLILNILLFLPAVLIVGLILAAPVMRQ